MKNKKGVWAMRVVAGIVILLLSAWAILFVFKSTAYAAQGKSQTETCRLSNAIKAGLEEKSGGWATGARLCSTIDKTEGDSQVPTEKYPQDSEGAAAEIRDMIANCWYMWLEGSQPNMFTEYPDIETCFVCYMFKIKDEDKFKDVTVDTIATSMDVPYLVGDSNEWCTINGGFVEEGENCAEGWKETDLKKPIFKGQKCCVREDATNVCENKGGECSETTLGGDYQLYLKWHCPGGEDCYVNTETIDNMETYAWYITKNGGDLYFIPPQDAVENRGYGAEEEYAISFVSPSWSCDVGCEIIYFLTTNPLEELKVWGLRLAGLKTLAVKKGENLIKGIFKEEPNFMIVSSLREAQNLGCTIE